MSRWSSGTSWAVRAARSRRPARAARVARGDEGEAGAPGPGAGSIETPGAVDVYRFEAAAGTSVYFDELSNNIRIHWSCADADGEVVGAGTTRRTGEVRRFTALARGAGGDYRVYVLDEGDEPVRLSLAPPSDIAAPRKREHL